MIEPETNSEEADVLLIVSSRLLAFPRDLVFEAFRDPDQLEQWWGPKGFTNTFHEFDLRPGGTWRLTLHGPDGANYENEKKFMEVSPPERIVFRHIQPVHDFQMHMSYGDVSGHTRLTWRMEFADKAGNEKFRDFILQANEENFDRLEAHLRKMAEP